MSVREVLAAIVRFLTLGYVNPFFITKVDEYLYRFPQPQNEAQWQLVLDTLGPDGIVVKLNAADEGPIGFSDDYAEQIGLEVHKLAIDPRDDGNVISKIETVLRKPDPAVLAQIDALVTKPQFATSAMLQRRKVGIHCTHAWDRSGFVQARARVMLDGFRLETAHEEWHRDAHYVPHGDRIPDPGLEAAWEDFVQQRK